MIQAKHIVLLFIIASCITLQACYSFTGASIPATANTFSVGSFVNNATGTNANYPEELEEAIKDKMDRQTRLNYLAKEGDLDFSGEIIKYEVNENAPIAGEAVGINRFTISLRVQMTDKNDEKANWTETFTRYADLNPNEQFLAKEDSLILAINEELVDDIFNKAFSNW